MCDVPNDFHVPNLSPLCSWLWPGAGCSRLPGLRLRHCLTGEVCCARRCHDVCCFLQILISWVSFEVSFEVSCCFFIVSWCFLFAKKLQSFGVPCWACQYLGPLHLRAFLSIPADSALPATLFLKDVSSQLATGTEQSSKVKHAYLISQIWSTPKKLHHFRLCYRKIIQLCSEWLREQKLGGPSGVFASWIKIQRTEMRKAERAQRSNDNPPRGMAKRRDRDVQRLTACSICWIPGLQSFKDVLFKASSLVDTCLDPMTFGHF